MYQTKKHTYTRFRSYLHDKQRSQENERSEADTASRLSGRNKKRVVQYELIFSTDFNDI